jgi:hypothetical protein
MTFEYDRIKRFATIKREFVYFFNSFIILDPIKVVHKNSSICSSSIGPTLLVTCCVKAISIHVIYASGEQQGHDAETLSRIGVDHGN